MLLQSVVDRIKGGTMGQQLPLQFLRGCSSWFTSLPDRLPGYMKFRIDYWATFLAATGAVSVVAQGSCPDYTTFSQV